MDFLFHFKFYTVVNRGVIKFMYTENICKSTLHFPKCSVNFSSRNYISLRLAVCPRVDPIINKIEKVNHRPPQFLSALQ